MVRVRWINVDRANRPSRIVLVRRFIQAVPYDRRRGSVGVVGNEEAASTGRGPERAGILRSSLEPGNCSANAVRTPILRSQVAVTTADWHKVTATRFASRSGKLGTIRLQSIAVAAPVLGSPDAEGALID